MHSDFWKTFFSLLGITILIIVLIIGGMTLYFTWQLRYGNADTVRNIYETYETKFSAISGTRTAQRHIDNADDLIQPYNQTLGNVDAPVKIIAFIDFACPYCQEQYEVFNYIRKNYEPATYIVFKHLPLASIHPQALDAARASTCAAEQNKFWEYHDQLFLQQNLDQAYLYSASQKIGLNSNLFNTCLSYHMQDTQIEQDLKDAVSIDLRGTPTYIINGDIIEGSIPQQDWDELILNHLNQ